MKSTEQAKWHWAEGMKFALEGVKLIFILNGASAVAILTFVGNMKVGIASLVWAMLFFAFGAVTAVPAMIFAYLTQLYYGNASQDDPDSSAWRTAVRMHYCAYAWMGAGLALFAVGAILAAHGFMHLPATSSPCPTPH
jgi:hypothetical protein